MAAVVAHQLPVGTGQLGGAGMVRHVIFPTGMVAQRPVVKVQPPTQAGPGPFVAVRVIPQQQQQQQPPQQQQQQQQQQRQQHQHQSNRSERAMSSQGSGDPSESSSSHDLGDVSSQRSAFSSPRRPLIASSRDHGSNNSSDEPLSDPLSDSLSSSVPRRTVSARTLGSPRVGAASPAVRKPVLLRAPPSAPSLSPLPRDRIKTPPLPASPAPASPPVPASPLPASPSPAASPPLPTSPPPNSPPLPTSLLRASPSPASPLPTTRQPASPPLPASPLPASTLLPPKTSPVAVSTPELQPDPVQAPLDRSQYRVLIIECGFGRIMNPLQTQVMLESGFEISFVEALPNPELPGVHVMAYLAYLQQAIEEFEPDLIMSASKGAPYMIAAWETGMWTGPSVMINRHPKLGRLPRNTRVILCQGSRDEVYPILSRQELEDLARTGSQNHTFLYYTGDAGACLGLGGQVCRMGDSHNQESIVMFDCLPRLADAALAEHEPPDMNFLRSTISLAFTPERLRAEEYLGYMPDQVMKHWLSAGGSSDPGFVVEVPSGSQEHRAVQAIFQAAPKVPRAYDSPVQGDWQNSQIIRIERVENMVQMLACVQPQFHSMQWSVKEQELGFEPGVHTRWAFHGTDSIEQIVRDPIGFRAGSGVRTVWGTGTYFARDAEYCTDGGFCLPRADGTRKLLLCLLATGMPCLGDPAYRGVLPIRQGCHRYNSAVDSLSNPEVYVTHAKGGAYPAYIITFT